MLCVNINCYSASVYHHYKVASCFEKGRIVVKWDAFSVRADPTWVRELSRVEWLWRRSNFFSINVFAASSIDPAYLRSLARAVFLGCVELNASNLLGFEMGIWLFSHFKGDGGVLIAELDRLRVCWEVCICGCAGARVFWLDEEEKYLLRAVYEHQQASNDRKYATHTGVERMLSFVCELQRLWIAVKVSYRHFCLVFFGNTISRY